MQIDRRIIAHFDWSLFVLALVLALIGILTINSASHDLSGEGLGSMALRQFYWLILGLVAMVVSFMVDYHRMDRFAYAFYALVFLLLLLVPLLGVASGGSLRWLDLGFVFLQPSELAKLAVVFILAKRLQYDEPLGGYRLRDLWLPSAMAAPMFFVILIQPDLGTAVVFLLIFVSIISMTVFRIGPLLFLGATGVALLPIGWLFLKPYQKVRIQTFLAPDLDPLGAGYHVIQSKIAIGSGRWFGQGYLQGSQNQLDFLPARHTDFIFSVFAEEWGFFGCLVLLGIYLTLVLLSFRVVSRARDRLGALLAFGAAAILSWQIVINVAMVTGFVPVVGIPLPFLTYGGSSLVATMVAVGLLINVSMRRFMF